MAYVELRPIKCRPDGTTEDVYDTVTIPADWSGATIQAELYAPGSSTVSSVVVNATIQSTSPTSTTILVSIVGQTMYAGEWTGSLWRVDPGNRTDSVDMLLEVTQFPSAQGG